MFVIPAALIIISALSLATATVMYHQAFATEAVLRSLPNMTDEQITTKLELLKQPARFATRVVYLSSAAASAAFIILGLFGHL
ncbi:MAG: hypothetical protein GC134_03175 [Proteobacteria bacterium]|nr:hypothetical protein [Pseudomonadota bacterium]